MAKPFPTSSLSRSFTPGSFSKMPAFDPTIKGTFDSGDPFSRGRFTSLLYLVEVTYNFQTQADIELVEDFQEHVKIGADKFTWRNKNAKTGKNEDWEVRLAEPIRFQTESQLVTTYSFTLKMYGKVVDKMRTALYQIEDLAADADLSNIPMFVNPKAVTIESIGILTQGAPAGVDDSNTVVIAVKDDAANTLVSKTYNTATQPPSSDYEDLGSISYASLNAGEHLTLSVTQGTTANMPAFIVVIEYYYTS